MKIQSKELIAGSFVVGGLIGLLAIIAVLGDFMQRTDPYYTKVNNVAGLKRVLLLFMKAILLGLSLGLRPSLLTKV